MRFDHGVVRQCPNGLRIAHHFREEREHPIQSLEPLRTGLKIERVTALCEGEEACDALRGVCELGADGALLVRPDGHVAWRERSLTQSPAQTLRHVFEECYIR
jgi:hypothetical protein